LDALIVICKALIKNYIKTRVINTSLDYGLKCTYMGNREIYAAANLEHYHFSGEYFIWPTACKTLTLTAQTAVWSNIYLVIY